MSQMSDRDSTWQQCRNSSMCLSTLITWKMEVLMNFSDFSMWLILQKWSLTWRLFTNCSLKIPLSAYCALKNKLLLKYLIIKVIKISPSSKYSLLRNHLLRMWQRLISASKHNHLEWKLNSQALYRYGHHLKYRLELIKVYGLWTSVLARPCLKWIAFT